MFTRHVQLVGDTFDKMIKKPLESPLMSAAPPFLSICFYLKLCRTMYSAHDTTLLPLLVALGMYDGRWPPFASYIAFELYQVGC